MIADVATYLDTSALVKLVIAEHESVALRAFVAEAEVTSSVLARTELLRAARRHPDAKATDRANDLLDRMRLVPIDEFQFIEAGRIPPPSLRSLDALHLVSALRLLRADLQVVVTYDGRMADAARLHGLPVASPGAGL
jgi:predicted nucleic acid-binding protein